MVDCSVIACCRGFVISLEALYSKSATSEGFIIPIPPYFTGRVKIALSKGERVFPMIAGIRFSLIDFSSGLRYSDIPGSVRIKYVHLLLRLFI